MRALTMSCLVLFCNSLFCSVFSSLPDFTQCGLRIYMGLFVRRQESHVSQNLFCNTAAMVWPKSEQRCWLGNYMCDLNSN
ncbi:hypothetical protein HDK64DRAFT_259185 [Phyllosticta capitalensis]